MIAEYGSRCKPLGPIPLGESHTWVGSPASDLERFARWIAMMSTFIEAR